MLINTDLSADTTAASLQRQRTDAGATASQPASTEGAGSATSQIDASLQRLTDLPASIQDADLEIQDEAGAGHAVEMARQSMLQQPGTAMAAQANQLSSNVLGLLQSI
jgi:flagellin-like hook-associated protein FlgL